MFGKIVLAAWSAAGIIWWILAWRLVAADQRKPIGAFSTPPSRSLSIFKPLPPLGLSGIEIIAPGLESFIAQVDSETELLLGIHEADRTATASFLDRMRQKYPATQLKVIFRSTPDDVANPKIAWQKILATHARGELWLWSDADIVAPPEFLRAARAEYEQREVMMLTFPYIVREIPSAPALLDALFVNAEFYPGALLLRRLGPVDFGFGASVLFARNAFLDHVKWHEIGSELADDFFLGQKLKPVRIGMTTLATVADATTWREALAHDLRWARTIRWNRPSGFAARILPMPVLGWLGWTALHPLHFLAWAALLGMIQFDVIFAAILCQRIGCALRVRDLLGMELWSLWRILLWFLCWAPGSVRWSGKTWRGPRST